MNEQHSFWMSAGVIKPTDECRGFEREGHAWPGRATRRQGGVIPCPDLPLCCLEQCFGSRARLGSGFLMWINTTLEIGWDHQN